MKYFFAHYKINVYIVKKIEEKPRVAHRQSWIVFPYPRFLFLTILYSHWEIEHIKDPHCGLIKDSLGIYFQEYLIIHANIFGDSESSGKHELVMHTIYKILRVFLYIFLFICSRFYARHISNFFSFARFTGLWGNREQHHRLYAQSLAFQYALIVVSYLFEFFTKTKLILRMAMIRIIHHRLRPVIRHFF